MDSFLDYAHLIAANLWTYGVTFLLVLSVLVFVHEWGHFIVARLCGVRVDTFSIGFGREIFGFTSKTGTRWKFSMVPLGGYVKMFGDTDPASAGQTDDVDDGAGHTRKMTDEERKGAFFAKSVAQRAAVVFAGPAVNFLFAVLLLSILYGVYGKPLTPPQVTGLEATGAAARAGFEPQDIIKKINGKDIVNFEEIRQAVMLALDTPMDFVVERDGKEIQITATPDKKDESDRFGFKHQKGYMGLVGPANGIDASKIVEVDGVKTEGNLETVRKMLTAKMDQRVTIRTKLGDLETSMIIKPPAKLNEAFLQGGEGDLGKGLILGVRPGDEVMNLGPVQAVGVAVLETEKIVVETLKAIWQMVTGTRSATELGGIIRIGAMAGDMAQQGYVALLTFTALLSINLGLINLFPIPMLDGGHLLFYGVEAVRGQPLSERVQEYAFRFGLVVLVTLMVFANLNDVLQLIFKFT